MIITFFIGGLSGGGAERVVCNLSNNFIKKGHEVYILTFERKITYYLNPKIKHICLNISSNNKIISKLKKFLLLKEFLEQHTTDVYLGFLPIETILLLVLKRKTKSPIIVSERNWPHSYPAYLRILLRTLYRRADGIVFQTDKVRRWYSLPKDKRILVIPNPINADFKRMKDAKSNYIISVGRLCRQKNFQMLINAYYMLPIEHRNKHKLIIYGEGEYKKRLERQINKLGLHDQVKLSGYTCDIKKKMEEACIYILSSDYEGMPNSLMEAMAIGVPCIATDCDGGGAGFLIENGRNGILVPKNSASEMKRAILYMLENSEKAENMGNCARKITKDLDPERICEAWEHFIRDIVQES